MGFSREALLWIKSYSQDRSQQVASGSNKSEYLSTNLGVPQGSVSGPSSGPYCSVSMSIISKPDLVHSKFSIFYTQTISRYTYVQVIIDRICEGLLQLSNAAPQHAGIRMGRSNRTEAKRRKNTSHFLSLLRVCSAPEGDEFSWIWQELPWWRKVPRFPLLARLNVYFKAGLNGFIVRGCHERHEPSFMRGCHYRQNETTKCYYVVICARNAFTLDIAKSRNPRLVWNFFFQFFNANPFIFLII